ncbi:MAG: tetratricopeptide repeat protein [Ktedonobacteraceae bacterium]|nr:tetratricopeptide repeat protein [Ktedonobacteraceae bacterium]
MDIQTITTYWQEVQKITRDLHPGQQLSTVEIMEYLNEHLPEHNEKITKPKINYLRTEGILHPLGSNEGGRRTNWRYTIDDVRRALLVELLKTKEDLSVQESKGWLRSFEEQQNLSKSAGTPSNSQPPTSVNSAYSLLRNRVLGTLIFVLGFGKDDTLPIDCVIAIRPLDDAREIEGSQRSIFGWQQAQAHLENAKWFLAASDSSSKLYIYPDLAQLQEKRTELAVKLHQHYWYSIPLEDMQGQLYELILGLSTVATSQPEDATTSIQLKKYPSLTTLLRAAFINRPEEIRGGTPLSAMVEIIAMASDAWDYCVILTSKGDDKDKGWLEIQEYSAQFPAYLSNKRVEIGEFLTGWSYRYNQSMVVTSTIKNDPRIAHFAEERSPKAAVAVPIITPKQRVAGAIYVARAQPDEKQLTSSKKLPGGEELQNFSDELVKGLEAFGYICGDMIAREQIEIETSQNVSKLAKQQSILEFSYLSALLQSAVNEVHAGITPEKALSSWIYLLVLNIQTTAQDVITQWLCQRGIEIVERFLANRLWDMPHSSPLPVGIYKDRPDRYVFAILQAVELPEKTYKQKINILREEMSHVRVGRLAPEFSLSTITLRYEHVRREFLDRGEDKLIDDIAERAKEKLIAGPYFTRGHEAMYKGELDRAVAEFEGALRYVPDSWYGYKHLAEARMLQSTDKSIDLAIEKCREAVRLNPDYASAHCLLADCLSYQGRFSEALIEYEKALKLDSTRATFLTRYGLALAAMTSSEYKEALAQLTLQEPELMRRRQYLTQPWLEAIDKFDQVRRLRILDNEDPEEGWRRLADYHYHRGYANLQARLLDEAIEDFSMGRRLAPDDLQLAQAYSYALRLQRRKKEEDAQEKRASKSYENY